MHLIFQFWIDICDHFSPNFFGKSTFTYRCACQAKVQSVPRRSRKVEIAGVIGIWKCLLECQDWSPIIFYYLQIAAIVFCDMQFLERYSLWRVEILHKHVFVKCPKNRKLFWPPKWQLTGVEDFNIEHWPGQHPNTGQPTSTTTPRTPSQESGKRNARCEVINRVLDLMQALLSHLHKAQACTNTVPCFSEN